MPNNTLEKWEEKTLDEICIIGDGNHSSNYPKKDELVVKGVPFIRGLNFCNGTITSKNMLYITSQKHMTLKKGHIQTNDILFTNRGDIGKVAIVPQEFNNSNLNSQLVWLRCNEDINYKFLYYFLCSPETQHMFKSTQTGAALQQFPIKLVKKILVTYPNIEEQQRIVGILDEAFENIEKTKRNTLQNLNNAKELYNIQKENIFKDILCKTPVDFGSIIETLTDYHANGSYKLLKEHVELLDNDDYAWMIRSTDFENNFKNSFKYINKNAYNFLEKTKIYGNEIIMSKIGNAGKIYLMPVVNRPVSLAMNLFLIRVKEKYAVSSYVYHFLLTDIGQKQINERCKGAATQTITKDSVRSIKIYLPNSIEEQQKIVQQLDELQEQTKKLEQIYTQKLKDLDELKQSILQKAFNGEL